jgi:predicted TIM-barrel fold metal-dependent hydrolase
VEDPKPTLTAAGHGSLTARLDGDGPVAKGCCPRSSQQGDADAASEAFYPALSLCDLIFSGVFERHPGLTLAIVEFELAWAPHLLSTMDYTYRERHGEAFYRFKDGMLPSDFFRRNVVLSFQEDAIGIRLRDAIGVDDMMWGSDYPHSESNFPQSRKTLAEILAGVPDDEQAKIAGGNTARVYNFDVASVTAAGKLGAESGR